MVLLPGLQNQFKKYAATLSSLHGKLGIYNNQKTANFCKMGIACSKHFIQKVIL
jgi:hypothetical protein